MTLRRLTLVDNQGGARRKKNCAQRLKKYPAAKARSKADLRYYVGVTGADICVALKEADLTW